MNSHLTDDFVDLFRRLPKDFRVQARRNYRLWRRDAYHPSLQFKRVSRREPIYSVRIGLGWRALGLFEGDSVFWFWIGSHADYDGLIKNI